ncbi:MAG TPA: SUMF1/EgtB/PvdO family nonheme iron enzyme, partial [Blastocatellia bacterium]|nr:SUMF1/EgtB/PvdO family nonheme iron enzyme [Blastocatellia bacterium]
MQAKRDKLTLTNVSDTIELFKDTRSRTMQIVEPLETEDYVIQTAPYMSPPRWHIGHTSWFFELLLKDHLDGYKIFSEDYLYYFNSYYERFGTRIDRDKRGTRSRPTVKETVAYRKRIDDAMLELLERCGEREDPDALLSLVRLGLEHEMQHQELLVYDIKHLLCDLYKPKLKGPSPSGTTVKGMAEIEGGLFLLGHAGDEFAFDNEKPAHQVFVQDFAIDRVPVSNGDYLEFMRDNGYSDFRWWFSDAWYCIQAESWHAPLYWELDGGEWLIRDFSGLNPVKDKLDEPVTHISFYEASAF